MNSNVRILGAVEKTGDKISARRKLQTVWELKELENAFQFYIPGQPDKELYLEHDELTAAGEAYKERGPLNALSVVDFLEEQTPDFDAIKLSDKTFLIRKRLARSTGLVLTVNNRETDFIKDATLETINFMDFYFDFLKPKTEGRHENTDDPQDSDIPLRLARTGSSRA